MRRLLVFVVAATVAGAATAAAADDPGYERANARLARSIPAFPRARLLLQEPFGGGIGSTPFEAVQRIYALSRPLNQLTATAFYARKLGRAWRWRGELQLRRFAR